MADLKMPDINMVMIAGNLTSDPSFRRTTNGTPVANFYIASNRRFKDNTGQWRENVCYVGVVAWYKLAESCYENLHKGSAVLIDGELQSRAWKNQDGSTKNVVEIKARRIQFLNKRPGQLQGVGVSEETYVVEDIVDDKPVTPPPVEGSEDLPEKDKSEPNRDDFDFGYDKLNI
ncbi:MAG: single-stranded DNA-binding protein [Calditrichaeota bacterium]|nr:MAG: single-stranded DNA-binding protein [Calditrichota bacterium]